MYLWAPKSPNRKQKLKGIKHMSVSEGMVGALWSSQPEVSLLYNGSRRMFLMTSAIQTYDVKAAARILLLFCVLIPALSTSQLCFVTRWDPRHNDLSACVKNAFSQRSKHFSFASAQICCHVCLPLKSITARLR